MSEKYQVLRNFRVSLLSVFSFFCFLSNPENIKYKGRRIHRYKEKSELSEGSPGCQSEAGWRAEQMARLGLCVEYIMCPWARGGNV